jgi:hypothetical protein
VLDLEVVLELAAPPEDQVAERTGEGVRHVEPTLPRACAGHPISRHFFQPVLGKVALSGVFLLSVAQGRPLIGRFARDFCTMSPDA